MKKLGKSATHDNGFHFFLAINIKLKIKDLIHDIHVLEECMESHNKLKNESWYNSKTECCIISRIDGYDCFTRFTLKKCKELYKERKQQYNVLLSMCEDALNKAIENTNAEIKSDIKTRFGKPYSEDEERKYVIVEENVEDI